MSLMFDQTSNPSLEVRLDPRPIDSSNQGTLCGTASGAVSDELGVSLACKALARFIKLQHYGENDVNAGTSGGFKLFLFEVYVETGIFKGTVSFQYSFSFLVVANLKMNSISN